MAPVLLCWYASIGDINSIKELIALGVDINAADYDNRTALHLAAAQNKLEILELLIFHNVLLKTDNMGETAFMDAIRSGSLHAITLLK